MDKETKRKKAREYYQANKERLNVQHKEYMAAHKEEQQQKRKERYEKNREKEIQAAMERKRKNKDATNATGRRYHANHKEEANAKRRAYGALHREELNARQRAYSAANRERLRGYYLKKHYGLSLDEWSALYETQDGGCAICKQSFETIHKLKVDHCHNSEKVRGLLCSNCNTAIGLFKEDINVLQSAIEYITKHNGIT